MNSSFFIVILLLIGLWFFVLRTRSSRINSKEQFETMVTAGEPVVADFFSNT